MGNTRDIALPPYAQDALHVLEGAGFEAWCVGGFVRDALRRAPVHDLDIATDAPWDQVARAFRAAGFPVHETGTRFGTVTAVVDGRPLEITTYRQDGMYRDARHPDGVSFVSTIEEDLARRDFTMNAIAYHPLRGVRDPFRGAEDLERGVIRAVGSPRERFAEDALRILRGVRFSAQLGFPIELETFGAMERHAGLLGDIAAERVRVELEKLLVAPFAGRVLLQCRGILSAVLPELSAMAACPQNTPYHIYDVLEHTAHVVDQSPATPLSRWAALFHDAGKPGCRRTDARGRDHFKGHPAAGAAIARDALARLKAPARLTEDVCTLVRCHECYTAADRASVARALRQMGGRAGLYRSLLLLQVADSSSKAPGYTQRLDAARAALARLDGLLAGGMPVRLSQLAVGGDDLIAQGWQPGPALGSMLDELLALVMDGVLENDRSTLLGYASTDSTG